MSRLIFITQLARWIITRVSNYIIILSVLLTITIPSVYGAEIPHAFVERNTPWTFTGNTGWNEVPNVNLASGNFTTGNEYLIIFNAKLGGDDVNDRFGAFSYHGATGFTDSALHFEPSFDQDDSRYVYTFFEVWTAIEGEDVHLAICTCGDSANTVTVDDASIFAIDITDLTEDTDWFFDKRLTDDTISTTWTATNPTFTFTPSGTDDWLVLGFTGFDNTSVSANQQSRINLDDTTLTPMISQESEDITDKNHQFLMRVYTPDNNSHTFEIEARTDSGTTGTRDVASIFAINLELFDVHADSYTALTEDIDTNNSFVTSPTLIESVSITPNVSGDVYIMDFFIQDMPTDDARTAGVLTRMQIDNVDSPATQTSDAHGMLMNWDFTDELGYHIQSMVSMSSASTIDIDGSVVTVMAIDAKDSQIVAFTLELAGGATTHTIDVEEIEWILDTDEVTLITPSADHQIDVSEIEWILDSDEVILITPSQAHQINVSEIEWIVDSSVATKTEGSMNHQINVSEIEWIVDTQDVSRTGAYEPTGRYIWFNISPPTDERLGGVFSLDCGSGNYVQGILSNGTLICTALPP